jgi:hypothetical protein
MQRSAKVRLAHTRRATLAGPHDAPLHSGRSDMGHDRGHLVRAAGSVPVVCPRRCRELFELPCVSLDPHHVHRRTSDDRRSAFFRCARLAPLSVRGVMGGLGRVGARRLGLVIHCASSGADASTAGCGLRRIGVAFSVQKQLDSHPRLVDPCRVGQRVARASAGTKQIDRSLRALLAAHESCRRFRSRVALEIG